VISIPEEKQEPWDDDINNEDEAKSQQIITVTTSMM
jgi:hypothetical protein